MYDRLCMQILASKRILSVSSSANQSFLLPSFPSILTPLQAHLLKLNKARGLHRTMAANAGLAYDDESLCHKVQAFSSSPSSEDLKRGDYENIHKPTTLSERLGFEEFYSLQTWRASVAELLGTAVLVFALDSIYISSYEINTNTPNLVEACLITFFITVLILATAPVSGGHLNPTISFSAALVGLISVSRAAIYILAQLIGGVLGALALKAVIDSEIQSRFLLSGCYLRYIEPGQDGPTILSIDTAPAFWLETFSTFVLLFSSVWIAFDHRQAQARGPVIVFSGIGIVVGVLVFVSTSLTKNNGYSGVGMNPAKCFGPAIVRGGLLWERHWVFWVGPATASVAFYVYTKLIPRQHFKAQDFRYDFFTTVQKQLAPKHEARQSVSVGLPHAMV